MAEDDIFAYECPKCKTPNGENMKYCVKCGHWMLDTNFPAKPITEKEYKSYFGKSNAMSMTKKCKSCMSEIDIKAKKCPHCRTDQRNWFMRHKIITGIGGLILLLILASGNKNNTAHTTNTNSLNTVSFTATPKTWRKVIDFKGSSTKNTQSFNITSSEWRINWSTNPSDLGPMNFQIYVYKPDNTQFPVSIAANIIGKGEDTSYMRGAGEYYLMINTAQPYTIAIEETN